MAGPEKIRLEATIRESHCPSSAAVISKNFSRFQQIFQISVRSAQYTFPEGFVQRVSKEFDYQRVSRVISF